MNLFYAWGDVKCSSTLFSHSTRVFFSPVCLFKSKSPSYKTIHFSNNNNQNNCYIHKIIQIYVKKEQHVCLSCVVWCVHLWKLHVICVSLTWCSRWLLHCAYRYSEQFEILSSLWLFLCCCMPLSWLYFMPIFDSVVFPRDWIIHTQWDENHNDYSDGTLNIKSFFLLFCCQKKVFPIPSTKPELFERVQTKITKCIKKRQHSRENWNLSWTKGFLFVLKNKKKVNDFWHTYQIEYSFGLTSCHKEMFLHLRCPKRRSLRKEQNPVKNTRIGNEFFVFFCASVY